MTITVTTTDISPDTVTQEVTLEILDFTPAVSGQETSVVITEATTLEVQVSDDTPPGSPVTIVEQSTIAVQISAETGTATQVVLVEQAPIALEVNEAGVPGPPGMGLPGPRGVDGPPGGGAQGMTFTQDIPATTWTIPHTFEYSPSVTVVDTLGNDIATEISRAPGVVTIHTVLPTAGRAYLI